MRRRGAVPSDAENQEVVNTEVEQESTHAESTPAETQNSEASSEPETKAVISDSGEVVHVKVDKSKEESKDADSDDESDEDRKPKRGKEARREQLERDLEEDNRVIRELVAKRNETRAYRQQLELDAQNESTFQPVQPQSQQLPTIDQIMEMENPETGDFFTEFEAKAVLQNLQLQQRLDNMQQAQEEAAYKAQVETSRSDLSYKANMALRDFPEFDPESDQYDEHLDNAVNGYLQSVLVYDQNGKVIGSKKDVYQLYKSFHKDGEAPKQRAVINDAGDFRGGGTRIVKPFAKLTTEEKEEYLRRQGHDI